MFVVYVTRCYCPQFNVFLLTNSLLGASSHHLHWEGGSAVNQMTHRKKRKQHGVFGSIQSSFVSNHHPHPLDTSLSSNSHFFHQPSWQNTVVIVNEKTQVFLINIWKSICTSVLDLLLPDWWQSLPQVDPCSRQVYLCWCDRFLSGSKKFCQVCHESVGEVQRACLLTSLMYQPWHSQFVHNLKNRWSRAGNET